VLSGNPAAIHLLEKNQDKVVWWEFSHNPNICVVDVNETRNLIKKKVAELLE
jgi:cystathionine beta-lyase/cystathionine gamma-synthase